MTPSPSDTLTNKDNELDQLATHLAAQVRAGRMPEKTARMQIFEKVYTSGILQEETRRWCRKNSVPLHMHESVVDEVDHFYMLKILDLPTESAAEKGATDSTNQYGRKFFDLNQFADGASATGSIRQALSDYTLMHQTHYRSARRRTHNVITSTDLLEGNIEPGSPLSHLLKDLPIAQDTAVHHVLDAGRDERIEGLHAARTSTVRGKRGTSRTMVEATTVQE